jgi:hypothetical protein
MRCRSCPYHAAKLKKLQQQRHPDRIRPTHHLLHKIHTTICFPPPPHQNVTPTAALTVYLPPDTPQPPSFHIPMDPIPRYNGSQFPPVPLTSHSPFPRI